MSQDRLERVSKIPPECNPQAGDIEKRSIGGEQELMTNQQSTKLAQPGVGSFHDPATLITTQFTSILIPSLLAIGPVRCDQIDTAFPQSLPQRIGIVRRIRNHSWRLLPRTALATRDADLGERGFRKFNFMRRGTFQPNSQRNTLTVDQYHPFCALATLGFTDARAPFLAGAKLPSRKASSHCSRPFCSKAPSRVRHACSQTPFSSHCCSLRQQVEGEGNSSGRKRQAAPVCKIHKIPSKQSRLGFRGRPCPFFRRFTGGSNGSIKFHCSSLNSFCRFFMTEAQQLTPHARKYLG